MKYQNRQTGVVAELISKDEEKTRMVILQGPDKPISCTISTFKRWWKKVDEEVDNVYVAEVMEQKKELGIECPPIESYEVVDEDTCADGRKYSEIGKEIAEQAKQKAKDSKKVNKESHSTKSKKETKPIFDSESLQSYIKDYITSKKGEITKRVKKDGTEMHKVALKVGGHMFGTMSYSKYAVTVNVRPVVVDNPHKTIPGIFGARFIFNSDTSEVRKQVKEVIDKAIAHQTDKNSNSKKSKKVNKEEK